MNWDLASTNVDTMSTSHALAFSCIDPMPWQGVIPGAPVKQYPGISIRKRPNGAEAGRRTRSRQSENNKCYRKRRMRADDRRDDPDRGFVWPSGRPAVRPQPRGRAGAERRSGDGWRRTSISHQSKAKRRGATALLGGAPKRHRTPDSSCVVSWAFRPTRRVLAERPDSAPG